ncbi:hypothetical protein BC936DRAFT_146816 [Jimgerdemannia flammicorona]|uniref:Uncharacterized protein n=1 Tax=Jimgerdemannia flammicorona TaxID=994334 RepID=A0A433D6V0_9FUNG|nr:hypothetical protein BC936DRAFT_146816 [Jimgerdemannia flammicorona]
MGEEGVREDADARKLEQGEVLTRVDDMAQVVLGYLLNGGSQSSDFDIESEGCQIWAMVCDGFENEVVEEKAAVDNGEFAKTSATVAHSLLKLGARDIVKPRKLDLGQLRESVDAIQRKWDFASNSAVQRNFLKRVRQLLKEFGTVVARVREPGETKCHEVSHQRNDGLEEIREHVRLTAIPFGQIKLNLPNLVGRKEL